MPAGWKYTYQRYIIFRFTGDLFILICILVGCLLSCLLPLIQSVPYQWSENKSVLRLSFCDTHSRSYLAYNVDSRIWKRHIIVIVVNTKWTNTSLPPVTRCLAIFDVSVTSMCFRLISFVRSHRRVTRFAAFTHFSLISDQLEKLFLQSIWLRYIYTIACFCPS